MEHVGRLVLFSEKVATTNVSSTWRAVAETDETLDSLTVIKDGFSRTSTEVPLREPIETGFTKTNHVRVNVL